MTGRPPWVLLGRDRRGAAALEFAAAGTLIMLLMLAIFDGGLLFMTQRALDYGLFKAARWAAVNSASLTTANVLSQFQSATSATLGSSSSSCQGYSSGASVPSGTTCYIQLAVPNGTAVGSVFTIQASYNWTPLGPITGFVAATLQSSIALPIQH